MADYTKNYNLKKPLPKEFYDVEDQNGNMDILDMVLAEHQKNTAIHLPGDGILPVEKGGTGGITAADARANLGAAANPNLLDNWYFADPINQRGKAIYTDVGYTIDRWYLGHKGGSGYPSVPQLSINNDGTITISNSSASYNTIFKQKIENIPAGTYTLSIMPVEITGTITFEAMRNGSGLGKIWVSSGYRQATFTIESDLNNLELVFSVSPNSSVRMKAVKLELGSQQTLARQENDVWMLNDPPPNKALELAKCQRYFQTFATQSLRPTDALDFRPVMRTTPVLGTISVNGKTLYTASADL